MRTDFRISSLVPSGLVFDGVSGSLDSIILGVRSETMVAECPLCGMTSRRIHSRYVRQLADLPSAGRRLQLRLITRRFRCEVPHCRRSIFAERFGEKIVPLRARRTARLEYIVHHLGLALGGRPAASLAKRLMLPVSNDTLLRVVRRRTAIPIEPLVVIGIDDWAFRRNHRYGTIVCDLERRQIVTLLPDREDGDHSGVAGRASRDQDRVARSRWRLWRGCGQGAAGGDPSRRPLASDGKCERSVPRRGATLDAPDPYRDRGDDHQSRAADLRRKAAISGLSAAPGRPCRYRHLSQGWRAAQGDRPADRPQSQPCPPYQPRWRYGCVPDAPEHPRWPLTIPGCPMERRLSQRCRTLAPPESARLQRIVASGDRMGDAASACRDSHRSPTAEGSPPPGRSRS